MNGFNGGLGVGYDDYETKGEESLREGISSVACDFLRIYQATIKPAPTTI